MSEAHEYAAHLIWTGNAGDGTGSYAGYGRQHRVVIDGKPDLLVTADPAFLGAADMHNPEDLFLSAIAGCHMLTYLALCAKRGVRVLEYEDEARGSLLVSEGGGGRFERITLRPLVTIAGEEHVPLALRLHDRAHGLCFLANSCSAPVVHEATVRSA